MTLMLPSDVISRGTVALLFQSQPAIKLNQIHGRVVAVAVVCDNLLLQPPLMRISLRRLCHAAVITDAL